MASPRRARQPSHMYLRSSQVWGEVVVDVMRTHPMIIIGGILQENPFFVPPDEFLRRLWERRRPVERA